LDSKLTKKYIFGPGYINPEHIKTKGVWVKFIQQIFRLIPSIGINASDLGKSIAFVGINGFDKQLLNNRTIRDMKRQLVLLMFFYA